MTQTAPSAVAYNMPSSPYGDGQSRHLADLGAQMRSSPGFTESLAIATWRLMSEDEQKSRLDMREFARAETLLAQQEIYQFEAQEVGYFQALNAYHQQNIDFVLLSEQWTPEERQTFLDQGLLPYVNNMLRRYARTYLGEKMGRETEVRARSRDSAHEPFVQAVNSLFRYFERRNNWKIQKHYVRRDGVVGSRGIVGVRKDPRDPAGALSVARYRPQEFMWHTRTAFSPRLEECKYFERIYYRDRAELMREYPEWYKEIREFHAGMWGHLAQHAIMLDTLIKPKVQPVTGSFQGPYVHNPSQYLYWRETVLCRDLYRRHPVTRYMVVDPYRKQFVSFDNYDQAAEWGRATYNYWSNEFLAHGVPFAPQIAAPRVVQPDAVEKLTWAGTILLRVEPVGETFPFKVFAPEFIDGQITSPFGHAKDMQRISNRMVTNLDEIGGAIKPKVIVNRWGMPPEYTNEDITDNLMSRTAPLIVSVPHGVPLNNVMDVTTSPQFGPVPEILYKLSVDAQGQMMGGENFIGQQESSAESGRAVVARQTAANLADIPDDEEFALWEKDVAEHQLQLIQEMDPCTIQAILSDVDPGQADEITQAFLSTGIQSLAEIDMDIEIVQTAASPSTKDRIVQTATTVIGQSQDLAKYWNPIIMDNMDIDYTVRKKVQAQMDADDQFAKQMQVSDQQHNQAMAKEELDIKYLDKMIKLRQLEIEANPPVRKSLMGQIDMKNPAMAATFLQDAQMDADPLQVARDMALGNMMKQGALDTQQEHRNALLLPEEIAAMKTKAERPYRNVPKVNNTSARADKTVSK